MLLCCSLALWFLVCFLAVTQYLPPWLSLCWVLLAAGSTDPVLLASGIQSAGRRTTRTLRCRGSFSVERELMPYGKLKPHADAWNGGRDCWDRASMQHWGCPGTSSVSCLSLGSRLASYFRLACWGVFAVLAWVQVLLRCANIH
ncbi:hypothetical protein OH76DRAFT_1424102 [Lentinus brumalis]|uniref:Uncharacterized protein n=1 Tax=Lentinus brumalis TaxID=2498619 RepID=A0A371CHL3_9APHY|nr:hypothetical protein OH76DRAFT_1424102 [Polyporus brumalis]